MPLLIEIQGQLDRELNLDQLAAAHGYSASHFHRLFSLAIGETPRAYVERLRMEKAAYKLWITRETVLDVALACGFRNHETFSRAFRRRFGTSPKMFREDGRMVKRQRVEHSRRWTPSDCVLSTMRFQTLRDMPLLARRHVGAYGEIPDALSARDRLWKKLVAWAVRHRAAYRPIAVSMFYDNPWLTPKKALRADCCLPIAADVQIADARAIRCIPFAGGTYAAIEHMGPPSTRPQAFRHLADTVHASDKYAFPPEPAVAIAMKPFAIGPGSIDRMEVYLPVIRKD